MEIKQVIIKGTTVFIFTEEPEKDILVLKDEYEKRDDVEPSFPLGYDVPELTDFTFLGNKYKCISLWFDNEDVPDFFTNL